MDEQIGRYRLIKELGEGAMARVYLAELETGIGFKRKVALKVVRPEYAKDKKFVALMGREAMIGSMLQHPNIVQTLEFNEADGRSFLALEFVEGETLGELLEKDTGEGPGLPLMVALEAMVQVLKGLSYAHNLRSPEGDVMGIVHRDLKPGNIMLSRHGLVKVMDFGIAKAKIASANITTAGQVRGTPIYMAPEQVTGKPLDGRADQFAAGTVLYELLTGKQLFIDNNLIRIMQRVARAEVQEQVTEATSLHADLGPILTKMWARDPNERYEDCEEAARHLEDIVFALKSAGRSVQDTSPSGPADDAGNDTDDGDDESQGLFGALGEFVRRLFGSSAPKAPPPKKKRRKRKRKRAAAKPPPVATRPESQGSLEVVFEDATSSNFEAPVTKEPAAEPDKPLDGTTARMMLGPQTGEESTVKPTPPAPQPAGESQTGKMDPFFYENFDE